MAEIVIPQTAQNGQTESHKITDIRLVDNGRGGYDDVRGVIVGGDFVTWQLFYDGRPQGQKDYADTDDEAIEAARQKCAQLKAEYCGHPCYLYPDNSKWEVRVK